MNPQTARAPSEANLETAHPLPPLLRWSSPLLAAGFGLGVLFRKAAYKIGLKRTKRGPIPVISVGNLTVGGTGKTPAVASIAKGLLARGLAKRPAILMRGYGAAKPGEPNDEAQELRRALPAVSIVVNPDRYAGAVKAASQGCDIAILDDGFQHWQLQRDLDIVLVDATRPFGGGHLLPWGWLRESPAALNRADLVIVTHGDLVEKVELDQLMAQLKRYAPRASTISSCHAPVHLRRLFMKAPFMPPLELAGKKVLAVCGLANPAAFLSTVQRLGATIQGQVVFPDHYRYSGSDLGAILEKQKSSGADWILVTAKDAVKLEALEVSSLVLPPTWSLDIEFKLLDGEKTLWERIDRCRYSS